MTEKSLIVLDNFYKNPHQIRQLASDIKYYEKPEASYPGKEGFVSGKSWEKERNLLKSHIDESVEAPCPKNPPFKQGKFRIATKADALKRNDLVHEDLQKWSAVIYLSLPEHCCGGVAYYKHKTTGCRSASNEWIQHVFSKNLDDAESLKKAISDHFKDPNNWEKIGEVPMFFNRAIILMAHCFHGSTGIFGDSVNSGRLTQHFEFYSGP